MQRVFVVDAERRPLQPCRPARARLLLIQHKAAVFRRFPFTIILKTARPEVVVAPLRVKLDPGAKTTGIAVVEDASGEVVWAAELAHRGQQVKERLDQRRGCRRSRRARHTRYRPPRFQNRNRRKGWLPPSLESRLANILTWVARVQRSCPIIALSMELVKFDMQLMQDAEISGVAYQQGTLAGYEIREYLLEKFARRCVYCGKTLVPFEVEHIVPVARGGSSRISNLTLACHTCNDAKGTRTAAEFGHPDVQAQAQAPLKDAASLLPAAASCGWLFLYEWEVRLTAGGASSMPQGRGIRAACPDDRFR
jgi:5-methylcytosine-specific restriction endonuclease McrA